MTATLLSSRQRAILEAMAEGQPLRASYGVDWRFVLDGDVVDGRSVYGLVRRCLVQWKSIAEAELVLTDAGRRAVGGER